MDRVPALFDDGDGDGGNDWGWVDAQAAERPCWLAVRIDPAASLRQHAERLCAALALDDVVFHSPALLDVFDGTRLRASDVAFGLRGLRTSHDTLAEPFYGLLSLGACGKRPRDSADCPSAQEQEPQLVRIDGLGSRPRVVFVDDDGDEEKENEEEGEEEEEERVDAKVVDTPSPTAASPPPPPPLGLELLKGLETGCVDVVLMPSLFLDEICTRFYDQPERVRLRNQPVRYGALQIADAQRGQRNLELRIDPPLHVEEQWRATLVHPAVDPTTGRLENIFRTRRVQHVPAAPDLLWRYVSQVAGLHRRQPLAPSAWREVCLFQSHVLVGGSDWQAGAAPALRQFAASPGVLMLMSLPGRGKTHALEAFFRAVHLAPWRTAPFASTERPLLVHFAAREVLSHDLARRWREALGDDGAVMHYADRSPAKLEHALVVVTTRDSLTCIDTALRRPTVLFIDESRTIWHEFLSALMLPRVDRVLDHFLLLAARATHVIFGDAYMTECDAILVADLARYRHWARGLQAPAPPSTLVRVLPPAPTRHHIFDVDEHAWLNAILRDARREAARPVGEREPAVVVCQTVHVAELVTSWLLAQGVPESALATYTRARRADVHARMALAADRINDMLPRLAVFIYSPVIGAGLNLTNWCSAVYGCLSYAGLSGSTTYVQMLYRARNVRCPNVWTNIQCHRAQRQVLESFDARYAVTRTYADAKRAFWNRNLQHSTIWRTIAQERLRKPFFDIHVDEAMAMELLPDQQLALDLMLWHELETEDERRNMGARICARIAESGDTFAVTFNIPESMRETAGGGARSLPSAAALEAQAVDTQMQRTYTVPDSVQLVATAEAALDESGGGGSIPVDCADPAWLPWALELRAAAVAGTATEEQARLHEALVVRPVVFGCATATEAEALRSAGVREEAFIAVRNALLGIDPGETDDALLRHHAERAAGREGAPGRLGPPAAEGLVSSDVAARRIFLADFLHTWLALVGETPTTRKDISARAAACSWLRANYANVRNEYGFPRIPPQVDPATGTVHFTMAFLDGLLKGPRGRWGLALEIRARDDLPDDYAGPPPTDRDPDAVVCPSLTMLALLDAVRAYAVFHGISLPS